MACSRGSGGTRGGAREATVEFANSKKRSTEILPHGAGGPGAPAERRMLLAMLEDAIQKVLEHGVAKPGELRSEPERWIFTNDRRAPFSFVNVCETLSLDPEWIRQKLLAKLAPAELAKRRRR